MTREVTCHFCAGTGKRTEWEAWEWALESNALHVRHVESRAGAGEFPPLRLISLDVEGSYPEALMAEHWESNLDCVERTLALWSMRGDDIVTSPRNNNGGAYAPVDPRFWDG